MTYQETLDYLYNCLPMYQRVGTVAYNKSLDNIIELCEALDNPQHAFKSIHVAGTNGKGSTSHSLAAILQSAGYKTGLYTSPHLKNFTERIRINGQEISQDKVVAFVEKMKPHFETIKPSFFEMTVAMAYDHFAQEEVDIAIIEVGLGGRLDSTNIITPLLSVITNISLDHQELLGDTLPEIAYEKAGIIKEGVPVVVSQKQPEVADVFIQKASLESAPLFFAEDTLEIRKCAGQEGVFDIYEDGRPMMEQVEFGLLGDYQQKNLAGIIRSIQVLHLYFRINEQAIRAGLAGVTPLTGLKGRWQKLREKPLVICDTGHNEEGLKNVFNQLYTYPHKTLHVVLGMVKDKSHHSIYPLFPKDAKYYFCKAQIPRAKEAHDLASEASAYGLYGCISPTVKEAVAKALAAAGPDDLIFIGGSTFVVAEIDEDQVKNA
jgi:dihydrofolate synthase / folylpolyglutamate synthase